MKNEPKVTIEAVKGENNSKKTVANEKSEKVNKVKSKSHLIKKESLTDLNTKPKLEFKQLPVEEQINFLDTLSWLNKIKWIKTLSKEQRIIYKNELKKSIELINKPKSDFDKENLFEISNYNFWYTNGKKQALFDVNLKIKKGKVTSLIGPSGCGKSTFIKNLNRMNDLVDGVTSNGSIWFNGINIKSDKLTDVELRSRVGMVFQKPTPFEMSIYENVAFGPRSHGITNKKKLDSIVEESLKDAALWDEVKNDLNASGTGLSGGQQQRLCIARAIALRPEAILMDEPTSALDPIATAKIEDLILKLSQKISIVVVTHSMAQAQRISDETVFFYQGKVIEAGPTKQIFTKPMMRQTKDYVNGKIG
ncbi:MAG: phosphate ABC transporter ATP-binding protein PstB [Mycoplasma sp.]